MKEVLIIEDDNFKAISLKEFIDAHSEFDSVEIVSSLVEAIDAVNGKSFALILVDMAIPSHPVVPGGGSPISLLTGGIEVLLELGSLGREDPCIIITQYPDIEISGSFFSLQQAKSELKKNSIVPYLTVLNTTKGMKSGKSSCKRQLKIYENSYFGRCGRKEKQNFRGY